MSERDGLVNLKRYESLKGEAYEGLSVDGAKFTWSAPARLQGLMALCSV
jgi:hypothetical protein